MGRRRNAGVVAGTAALLVAAGASFGAGSAVAAEPLIAVCDERVTGAPGTPVTIGGAPVGFVPESGEAQLQLLSPFGSVVCEVTAVAEPVVAPAAKPIQEAAKPVAEVLGVGPPAPAAPPPPAPAAPAPAPAEPPPPAPAAVGPNGAPAAAGPNGAPAPAAPAAQLAPPAPAAPFGPFLPQFAANTPPGAAPMFDYAGLFASSPGMFGSLASGDLFGYSPNFGILGAPAPGGAAKDVAAAGRVQALPTEGTDRVALPVLGAVLMLSMVTAALVRSWAHGATRG